MNELLRILFCCLILLIGCKHDEFDAKYAAKKYCECVQQQRALGKDFFEGRTKCDGMLLSENKFFRIDYMDLSFPTKRYTLFLPQNLMDSVAQFHSDFNGYLEKHCCKEAFIGCDKNDTLQIKMRALDSLDYR